MFVVGKSRYLPVMRHVIPPNPKPILWCQPIVTVAKQVCSIPLLGYPQVGVILQVEDDAQGLLIQIQGYDPLNQIGSGCFYLGESVNC